MSRDDPFPGAGAIEGLLRSTDWAAAGLGPVRDWPASLRHAVGTVLPSKRPMMLWCRQEETYWTFSHSPIRHDGDVVGLFVAAIDTSAEVVGRRRLTTLRDLRKTSVVDAGSLEGLMDSVFAVLARDAGVHHGCMWLVDEGRRRRRNALAPAGP